MFWNCMAAGAGGFIGSVRRYLVGMIPFLSRHDFPLQTLTVNFVGAFVIGLIAGNMDTGGWLSGRAVTFLKVGVCGGFTTFSTFSLESLGMIEAGRIGLFGAYAVTSVGLCLLGVLLGKAAAGFIHA